MEAMNAMSLRSPERTGAIGAPLRHEQGELCGPQEVQAQPGG
jgi:hypothetical protein